jgi:hypothetical protein
LSRRRSIPSTQPGAWFAATKSSASSRLSQRTEVGLFPQVQNLSVTHGSTSVTQRAAAATATTMNPLLVRRGTAALFCLCLAAGLRAQLPDGTYLLQDPTRMILGTATASVDSYGIPVLDLAWVDANGNVQQEILFWCPATNSYCREDPFWWHFKWTVGAGTTQFHFVRENPQGGWTTIASGTMS